MSTSASGCSDRRDDDSSKVATSWKHTIAGIGAYLLTPFLAFGLVLALMHLFRIY